MEARIYFVSGNVLDLYGDEAKWLRQVYSKLDNLSLLWTEDLVINPNHVEYIEFKLDPEEDDE